MEAILILTAEWRFSVDEKSQILFKRRGTQRKTQRIAESSLTLFYYSHQIKLETLFSD
jgi:hypothetical protein